MFDKKAYWENRAKGLRGQETIRPNVLVHYGITWPPKEVSKKALLKNSKRARKAAVK